MHTYPGQVWVESSLIDLLFVQRWGDSDGFDYNDHPTMQVLNLSKGTTKGWPLTAWCEYLAVPAWLRFKISALIWELARFYWINMLTTGLSYPADEYDQHQIALEKIKTDSTQRVRTAKMYRASGWDFPLITWHRMVKLNSIQIIQ
jgi:hypothetical protein